MLITQPIDIYVTIVAISHFSGLLVGLLLNTSSRVALFSLIKDVIQKIKTSRVALFSLIHDLIAKIKDKLNKSK